MRCTSQLEDEVRRQGFLRPAGVDEAGRGALFGPVFAAAVILDPQRPIQGLADSKALLADRRCSLAALIRENAVAWAVASADSAEIDTINILQASRLAMRRAVQALFPAPDYLLIDACTVELALPQESLIKGDARVQAIAAASILAKTARDACIDALDRDYPGYGLARHKGYPTSEHRAALLRLGPTPLHRRTYAPVREALKAGLLQPESHAAPHSGPHSAPGPGYAQGSAQ